MVIIGWLVRSFRDRRLEGEVRLSSCFVRVYLMVMLQPELPAPYVSTRLPILDVEFESPRPPRYVLLRVPFPPGSVQFSSAMTSTYSIHHIQTFATTTTAAAATPHIYNI